jgi:hypothetical protein
VEHIDVWTCCTVLGGAQMTLYSGDPKISVLHYRLVWKPNFILPFGLEPDFILPFPAAAEENLDFTVGIFHFLTKKVNFILPFSLGPDFILPFGLGPDFILPSQDFLGQVNTVSFARPLMGEDKRILVA